MNDTSPPRAEVHALIAHCKSAHADGAPLDQMRATILPEAIDSALSRLDVRQFLDWIKDDREFAYFYFDTQQSGVCAKPREVAALILEQIALDAIE